MKTISVVYLLSGLLALVFAASAHAATETVDGVPFKVMGERLDITPPAGWKVAWMSGDPKGEYFVEFVPQNEDVNAWKNGYLAITRKPYPAALTMKEIREAKLKIADIGLIGTVKKLTAACAAYEEITMRMQTLNKLYFAIGGGYCGSPAENAPLGEGAFIAFIESKNFIYKVQYGWRPQNDAEKQSSMWGIDAVKARLYRESIKSATVCTESKGDCKTLYTP